MRLAAHVRALGAQSTRNEHRRAELFYIHRPSDRLRRIAYNNALRTRGL
jgi:hypothetical protein